MELLFNNIKSLADKHNLTIKELERNVGLINGQIGKWKYSKPSIYKVELVAKFFDVSLDSLLSSNADYKSNTYDTTIFDLKTLDGYMKLNVEQRTKLKQDLMEYLNYQIFKMLK